MLSENIKVIRKSKGLSQEELAIRLHVVRQTISKWEKGLSIPDAAMLICISKVLETPVSILLGDNVKETQADDVKVISEKLEIINQQLAQKTAAKQKMVHWLFILLCAIIIIMAAALPAIDSSYMNWDYGNPETAVFGAVIHIFEWLFVRLAPIFLLLALVGIFLTRKKV